MAVVRPTSLWLGLLSFSALAQDPLTSARNNFRKDFENEWVRILRVRYEPHERVAIHNYAERNSVYIFLTNAGRIRVVNERRGLGFGCTPCEEDARIRKAVTAGEFWFLPASPGARRMAQEMDGIKSEYLQIELKTDDVKVLSSDLCKRLQFLSSQ